MNLAMPDCVNGSGAIPSIEMSRYLKGTPDEEAQFCAEFVKALTTFGFASLSNHSLDDGTVKEAFDWNRRFFDLPLQTKLKAPHPKEPIPHRGFAHVGQEVVFYAKARGEDDKVIPDIKETFDQGPESDELCRNRWLDEDDLPGFRHFMETFYTKCHNLHLELMRCIEQGLNLQPNMLTAKCLNDSSELRLTHYPPCEAETLRSGKAVRISEHTDFGTLTLLFQDGVGGLEVEDQTRLGAYLPIMKHHQSELIINVGDSLQRWTNDLLTSATHRVGMPIDNTHEQLKARYSIAYFGKPNRHENVATLKEFVTPTAPAKYGTMAAWEFNQVRLKPLF